VGLPLISIGFEHYPDYSENAKRIERAGDAEHNIGVPRGSNFLNQSTSDSQNFRCQASKSLDIQDWDKRYCSRERATEDLQAAPNPLLIETVERLARNPKRPRQALDLASGAGRNALWLAGQGWNVTAVDGSAAAIAILRERAAERGLNLDARVADLERDEFPIERAAWDLVAILYYLQRNLFEAAKRGVAPGGVLIGIAHITEPGEEPTPHRLRRGELETYFAGWEIVHYYEGASRDAAHQRPVAEIVARSCS
jgi:SAM-dependent methyltransferase